MKPTDLFGILIQSGLFGVLLGLVISGLKFAKTYIDAKTAEATAKIKDGNVKSALSAAEDCVTTVVLEMAQTVSDDLKAKSADGKLTAEDAAKIKEDAVTKVQALLSDDVTNTLNTVFGDAEAWVRSKIEAAVKRLKTANAAK
jgi:hypothetical protein